MKYNTKRYTITDLRKDEDFEQAAYEINLKDGYCFEDGECLHYAEDYKDLLSLITTIKKI